MVQSILQEKGQTLVMKLLHASVYSLSSYMLSDIADVIIELVQHDREVSAYSTVCIIALSRTNFAFISFLSSHQNGWKRLSKQCRRRMRVDLPQLRPNSCSNFTIQLRGKCHIMCAHRRRYRNTRLIHVLLFPLFRYIVQSRQNRSPTPCEISHVCIADALR